jgi:hypothetical protein
MTEPLPPSAIRLLLAVAAHHGWVGWDRLVKELGGPKAPASLTADMGRLIRGKAVQTRGSLDEAGLAAELAEAMTLVRQAQREGTVLTWKTRQTLTYALTPTGADMANLLANRG